MSHDSPYYLYVRNSTGIYYYQLKHSRKRGSTGCRDRDEAEAYVERLIHGQSRAPVSSVFGAFADGFFDPARSSWLKRQWKKGKRMGVSNIANRDGFLKNHILPRFEHRTVQSLRAEEIEDWLLDIERSNSTKNQILFTLRIILDEAVRRDLVSRNVARDVEQLAPDHDTPEPFTDDDLARLFPSGYAELEAIWGKVEVAVMAYLSLVSGARHSELRALEWRDIRQGETGGLIVISKTVRKDGSIGPTKNGEDRLALIDDRARSLLTMLRRKARPPNEDDPVFTRDGENPWWTNYTYKYFTYALEQSGIQPTDRRLVFHSFRHTYVTRLRRHNVDDEVVVATVGHSSATVTDLYDHEELEDRRRTMEQHRETHQAAFRLDAKTVQSEVPA